MHAYSKNVEMLNCRNVEMSKCRKFIRFLRHEKYWKQAREFRARRKAALLIILRAERRNRGEMCVGRVAHTRAGVALPKEKEKRQVEKETAMKTEKARERETNKTYSL